MAEVKRFEYRPYAVKPVRAWASVPDGGQINPCWIYGEKADAENYTGRTAVRVVILRESDYRNLVTPKRRAKTAKKGRK